MNYEILTCEYKNCKLIFERPVILPCGNSLCEHHLKQFNQNKFICQFCNDEHQIPIPNGFILNKTIIKIIDRLIQESDPLRKQINESFVKLNRIIEEYESIDPVVYIHEYFADIRNEVELHRKKLMNNHENAFKIIQKLNEKEQECKLNANKIKKIKLLVLKNDDLPFLKEKLRDPFIDFTDLNKLFKILNENVDQLKYEIIKYKNELLFNRSIHFLKYDETKTCLFGQLIIKNGPKLLNEKEVEIKLKQGKFYIDEIFIFEKPGNNYQFVKRNNNRNLMWEYLKKIE